MNVKKSIGLAGEQVAGRFILAKGWKILAKNYRAGFDEIDIIALSSDKTVVFCEVKTMSDTGMGYRGLIPEDNLTTAKLRKISRACQIFIARHHELIDPDLGWRIDLIAITLAADWKPQSINHYENI